MVVRVLAFARVRELMGFSEELFDLPEAASARVLWDRLVVDKPQLNELVGSTRIALNGIIVAFDSALKDGDEVALLPPVGGG